ncbi:MAG: hypothetical protein PHI49_04520 [Halothiobacillaceae bacterium]|mgnify:CR=1 FL=1|nr:hypothetical protein [Halothiobacillaceae bacterium]
MRASQKHGTGIGFAILGAVVAFFVWAAVAGADPGKLLTAILLIPLGATFGIAILLAVWAVMLNLAGRLLGR